ncbi:DUF3048 domain-containing protein [Lederbergia lenta]|uniref:DUF3048 domain-containing protein n=1 Tax=Lederbergia lenta TaxID=1467 RepID=UPI00203F099A|nr:DUF3048 domain-containing protein [Lederbergia lenta]
MLSKRNPLLIAAVIVLALSACSKGENKSAEREVEKNPQQSEENKDFERFPLTGIEMEENSEGRAVAVMVNNHPAARPQSGLSEADIVYEALAEGEVTRLLAIYQSEQPENIGPVRSARNYFIDLAQGYDSLFIAHGYSPDAKKMLTSGEIDNLNGIQYDGSLFKRSSSRKAPHNSYISFDSIKKGASELEYDMDKAPKELVFLDGEELSIEGTQTEYMEVSYGRTTQFTSEYKYDKQTKKYTRYSDGVQTTDLNTDKPVQLDNVIVMEVAHQVIDDAGRRAIDLTSGGRAFLLQKGNSYEVEWKNDDGRLIPYVENEPIGLVPGKTWVNIVPEMDIVSFEQ